MGASVHSSREHRKAECFCGKVERASVRHILMWWLAGSQKRRLARWKVEAAGCRVDWLGRIDAR